MYTQVRPLGQSLRIMRPFCGLNLASPDLINVCHPIFIQNLLCFGNMFCYCLQVERIGLDFLLGLFLVW